MPLNWAKCGKEFPAMLIVLGSDVQRTPSYVWMEEIVISFTPCSLFLHVFYSDSAVALVCLPHTCQMHIFNRYLTCSHSNTAQVVIKPGDILQICILFYFTQPWRLYSGSRTQTVKASTSWADMTVEQGPLSSLTEQFLACGSCSRLMEMLHSPFILCLGPLFPEPSFNRLFCPFRMYLNTCT